MKNEKYLTKKEEVEARIKEIKDSDPNYDRKQKSIRDVMERVIYLQPHIYKVIVGLGVNVNYDPDKDEYMDYYHVYTKYPHTNDKGLKGISVPIKIGKAIKTLIAGSPQFMFPRIDKAPFDRKGSILTINRISIDIPRESGRNELCRIIFGNKKNLGKVWNLEDIITKMGANNLKGKKRYHYIYDKVRFLNERIEKETDLENFLDLSNITLRIDPVYSYTFLD